MANAYWRLSIHRRPQVPKDVTPSRQTPPTDSFRKSCASELNGAITIGTLDGANLEICEAVGEDNFVAFGLGVAEVRSLRERRAYRPREICRDDARLVRLLDALASSRFCARGPGLHAWVGAALLDESDEYLHLADFSSYLAAHKRIEQTYAAPEIWPRMAIMNVARTGRFSSDRAVREYARDIWGVVGNT